MRCLLDKDVVRLTVVGLHLLIQRQPLPSRALDALAFWRAAERRGMVLCITVASANVLRQRQQYAASRFVLEAATELGPSRYARRWARRLRETTGLTPEDTMVLALSTFGTDEKGSILGAYAVVTYDQSLIQGYRNHLSTLQRRLGAMKAQLLPPFDEVRLPSVSSPDDFLKALTDRSSE
jgi:hypothetical protein